MYKRYVVILPLLSCSGETISEAGKLQAKNVIQILEDKIGNLRDFHVSAAQTGQMKELTCAQLLIKMINPIDKMVEASKLFDMPNETSLKIITDSMRRNKRPEKCKNRIYISDDNFGYSVVKKLTEDDGFDVGDAAIGPVENEVGCIITLEPSGGQFDKITSVIKFSLNADDAA